MSRYPVWTPDGNEPTFASTREGTWDLYQVTVGSREEPEPLLIGEGEQRPRSWSPDGDVLAFTVGFPPSQDICLLYRNGEASNFIGNPNVDESYPRFSNDGRFLAYVSDESGRNEVYVQRYPEGPRTLVSSGGGTNPAWGSNQIYYESLDGTVLLAADF